MRLLKAMISRRFLSLLLLIANLLCGQQVALAHMVGHAGSRLHEAPSLTIDDQDREHGSLESLSHVCTTCAALAGYDFPLNQSAPVFYSSSEVVALLAGNDFFPPSVAKPFQFRSRAPPFLQF